MELHLSPELEAVVRRGVEAGGYDNAEAYVAEAVELLQELEQDFGEKRKQFERKLAESVAEAERGELATEEEAREEMRTMKSEWSKSHSAA